MIAALALAALLAHETPPTPFTRAEMVEVIQTNYDGASDLLCSQYPGVVAVVGSAFADSYIVDTFQTAYGFALTTEARNVLLFWLHAACSQPEEAP